MLGINARFETYLGNMFFNESNEDTNDFKKKMKILRINDYTGDSFKMRR